MNLTDPNTTFAAFYCLTVTGVGTPLFVAPEVMVGEVYDESVDVYSFAILLLAMAVETDLPEWFEQRYKTFQEKKKRKKLKRPPKIMRVLRAVWEDGWRPYDHDDEEDDNDEEDKARSEDLEQQQQSREGGGGSGPLFFVPPSIRSLIVRCGSHDPKARPTFEQIMEELEGPVLEEILEGYAPFPEDPNRKVPFKRRAILPPAAEEGGDGKRDDGAETRRPSLAPSLEGTFGSGSSFEEGDASEFNTSSNPMTSTFL
jgi:serine/threonine protein kinase